MSSTDVSRTWRDEIERNGFSLLRHVYSDDEVAFTLAELATALQSAIDDGDAIRSKAGTIYAARNLLDVFPAARTLWQRPQLIDVLTDTLGASFGLVRALYFDKPPEQTWSLAWHKDLTIAVERNDLPSASFRRPTVKAGVPHVEAPLEILESMLTLRIHLDDVTDENGPLKVIPGSHCSTQSPSEHVEQFETILACRGDVPRDATAGFTQQRQFIAGNESSPAGSSISNSPPVRSWPDGYRWYEFEGL